MQYLVIFFIFIITGVVIDESVETWVRVFWGLFLLIPVGAFAVMTLFAWGKGESPEMYKTTYKATDKPIGYTKEETAVLIELWNSGKGLTVKQLAKKFGRSEKSIASKLSRENVYTNKTYTDMRS